MTGLLRIKLVLLVLLLAVTAVHGQQRVVQNLTTFDDKPLHFGYRLGISLFDFDPVFKQESLIRADVAELKPGFTAGLVASLRLSDYFDLRALPGLSFGERKMTFNEPIRYLSTPNPTDSVFSKKSTFIDLPLNICFKGRRYRNYRPYVIVGAGVRMDIAKLGDDNLIQLKRPNYYFEVGGGIFHYYQFFRFGVELKMCIGLNDVLAAPPDAAKQTQEYHEALERITSNLFYLNFYFE